MVKLDVSLLRYLEDEDYRALTALEMTMRNHDVAPTVLIERIAQLPHGGCRKRLQLLLRQKLIHHENTAYDGYAMKYGAYDALALHTLHRRGALEAVAHRIGCGKESDILLASDGAGRECVLKLQRLGRCSFRSVTRHRDYKGGGRRRRGASWFFLSRLAAAKEFACLTALHAAGLPVPAPIAHNRHAIVMELVNGVTLNNITTLGDPALVYKRALELLVRLAEHGLVHGDFNEFNILVTEEMKVIVIDFPQMVSINHLNAAELFYRDVENLANFFHRRFKLTTLYYPTLEKDVKRKADLDKEVFASGYFTNRQQQELERLMQDQDAHNDESDEEDEEQEEEDKEEGKEEEELVVTNEVKQEENEVVADITTTNTVSHDKGGKENEKDHENNNHEDEEDEDEEDESGSEMGSLDEDIAKAVIQRRQQNANFTANGGVNEAYVRSQVRRDLRQRDNHQFNKGLHRNVQKGRQKQKIRRQIKQGMSNGLFD
ncbi:putative conserved RIO1-domain protein [Trypanosoma theileri]|uniref:Serine/threonine-protein kinase RIO2 n=1 Tax=Trypanosoma theileri TaxID=67003 RepID=A0A1X0P272_9TRYP|nr:putative conserved RIO1-domain protein [Trypanosoma theileri]ORC90928.1 putative conserved RIO1-domain protein [Trypanosoma theileri]